MISSVIVLDADIVLLQSILYVLLTLQYCIDHWHDV